jgi:hypothetical protein
VSLQPSATLRISRLYPRLYGKVQRIGYICLLCPSSLLMQFAYMQPPLFRNKWMLLSTQRYVPYMSVYQCNEGITFSIRQSQQPKRQPTCSTSGSDRLLAVRMARPHRQRKWRQDAPFPAWEAHLLRLRHRAFCPLWQNLQLLE